MSSFLGRMRQMGQRPQEGTSPILEGPIAKTLLGLSVPMILAMFLVTGLGLVDMLYLGRVSKEAMAAVSLAFPVTYLLHTIAGAFATAATSLCSRLIGRGQQDQVRNLVLHVLLMILGLAAVATAGGLLILRPILGGMNADPVVLQESIGYATIYFLGALPALLPMIVNSLFRAEGDTIFPFKVMAYALALNVILDPIFIFGLGPVPRMEVAGAALTTVCSFTVASFIVLRELRNRSRKVHFDRSAWQFDPALLRDLGGVAGPAMIANLAMPISVYLINAQLVPYGTEALAAFGAGLRLLSFVFLPTLGLSMSMMIMVGQNHGAGQRQRVARITLTALGFALSLLAALALPVILFPRVALSIFTDDPAVIAAGVPLARWVTMARPMLSVVNITAFWFQARGQGLAGMLPNTFMRVILEPLGVYLGLRAGGLLGGWLGMAAGDFVGGGLCLLLLLWRLRIYVRQGETATGAKVSEGAG